jgi:putative addiction module component (TIGR02574 family)
MRHSKSFVWNLFSRQFLPSNSPWFSRQRQWVFADDFVEHSHICFPFFGLSRGQTCSVNHIVYAAVMVSADLAKAVLELPPDERLELARRLVESVVAPEPLSEAMLEGIRRVEDVASGRVEGLTEEQYRAALA